MVLYERNRNKSYTLAKFGLIFALSLKMLLSLIVVDSKPILWWDDKARANVVEAITERGYYPFELASVRTA